MEGFFVYIYKFYINFFISTVHFFLKSLLLYDILKLSNKVLIYTSHVRKENFYKTFSRSPFICLHAVLFNEFSISGYC